MEEGTIGVSSRRVRAPKTQISSLDPKTKLSNQRQEAVEDLKVKIKLVV